MRTIVTKYDGECRKCAADLPAGSSVGYERRIGVFCPGCTPTDPNEIRALREDAAERKAAKLEEWAEKRERRAEPVLNPGADHYSRDWAFITQPGRIPARARWNAAVEREYASTQKAREMRGRAASLRAGVRVKGDKERERQAYRDAIRPLIQKGQIRDTAHFGPCEILRVNAKSVSVKTRSGSKFRIDLNMVGREIAPTAEAH